jgi:hypothetical protein
MSLASVEMMQMDAQQKAYERGEAQRRAQEIQAENYKKIQDSMKGVQDQLKQFQQDLYDKKY